jgi:glycosyltransferase involved in cell wall biosynthesis
MRTAAFTIIAPNRRHYARALTASLIEQHPTWDRYVLLVDSGSAVEAEPDCTTVSLDALALPQPKRFAFRYTILELSTAVKPWMFAYLFALGYERVVYLDPDIVLFSPLAELDAVAPATLLLLTPHLTGSIEGDDHPSERAILQAGTYNLGFLAVWRQPATAGFLEWWQSRLEFQCLAEVERGLFVDQKWLDLAPGLFPGVAVLRHDGWNVAYWNLRQRTVRRDGDRLTVNGVPLRFLHFSGVEPTTPGFVSRHDGRLTLEAIGDAAPLVERYRARLREYGQAVFERTPYAFAAFTDGTPIPDAARRLYRRSVDLQDACGDDPFAHAARFRGIRDHARGPMAARLALESYRLLSRPRALVGLLPRPVRTAMRELLLGAPLPVAHAPGGQVQGRSRALPAGLNVAGYHRRDTGIGESARLCRRACERDGVAVHAIDVDALDTPGQHVRYGATVFHVNADRTPDVYRRSPGLFDAGAWNIGCWHWELGDWPDAWLASAAPLDEIWAPSTFIQHALSRLVTIPVVHMPHGVEVTELAACHPTEFGVPAGRFTFLCMFDVDSVIARKHPDGAVEAFARAFPTPTGAALLVKLRGGDGDPRERQALLARLRSVAGVYVVDASLSRARANGLLASCDAIVSLHRSEGFGLVLAEGMSLGKPVVATGWSGNMDFMDDRNACPVRYTLVELTEAHDHYPAGAEWAEPDVDHAADLMRRLAADAGWRAAIGTRAAAAMRGAFSPAAAGRRYRERLARLG